MDNTSCEVGPDGELLIGSVSESVRTKIKELIRWFYTFISDISAKGAFERFKHAVDVVFDEKLQFYDADMNLSPLQHRDQLAETMWKGFLLAGYDQIEWDLIFLCFEGDDAEPVVTLLQRRGDPHSLRKYHFRPVGQDYRLYKRLKTVKSPRNSREPDLRVSDMLRQYTSSSASCSASPSSPSLSPLGEGAPIRRMPSLEDSGRLYRSLDAVFHHAEVAKRLNVIPSSELTKELTPLGAGNFSVVWKGWYQGIPVAIKEFASLRSADPASFANEWSAMYQHPEHPNVLTIYGITAVPSLVLECLDLALPQYLRLNLSEDHCFYIAQQVAAGMCHLHSYHILHCDLAARNILVRLQPFEVKVADFGLSKLLSGPGHNRPRSTSFPIRSIAPECLLDGTVSQAGDVWSFGVLLYEIFTGGELPYRRLSNKQVLAFVRAGGRPKIHKHFPPELRRLMHRTFERKYRKRVTFPTLLYQLSKRVLNIPPEARRAASLERPASPLPSHSNYDYDAELFTKAGS